MKIIIILIICLFFSLSITPINEHITNLPTPQTPTAGPPPQTPIAGPPPAKPQPPLQPESGLQTQVNMLSTQITTTNAMAVEAKKKVDEISSQIDQLKEALKKKPDT
jgi:hypothetical protein